MATYQCAYCDGEFTAKPSERRKYCSHGCYAKSRIIPGGAGDKRNSLRRLIARHSREIDAEQFAADYHSSDNTVWDIAEKYHVHQSNVSKIARKLGLKTRRELGIRYRPEGRAKYNNCDNCRHLPECQERNGWGKLPCETDEMVDPDDPGEDAAGRVCDVVLLPSSTMAVVRVEVGNGI